MAQIAAAISAPEIANTQPLCILNAINHGAELASDATAAPIPRVTSAMGIAQQTSVADVVNSSNQLHFLGLVSMTATPKM
jgi:hypothetical protein